MLFLHTVSNIQMYRICTTMFSENNSIYSKYSFSVTMVTQYPFTLGICTVIQIESSVLAFFKIAP